MIKIFLPELFGYTQKIPENRKTSQKPGVIANVNQTASPAGHDHQPGTRRNPPVAPVWAFLTNCMTIVTGQLKYQNQAGHCYQCRMHGLQMPKPIYSAFFPSVKQPGKDMLSARVLDCLAINPDFKMTFCEYRQLFNTQLLKIKNQRPSPKNTNKLLSVKVQLIGKISIHSCSLKSFEIHIPADFKNNKLD